MARIRKHVIACDERKRLRKGALATKQSILVRCMGCFASLAKTAEARGTLSAVIARHRVGATRRPMTGSGGRSSIPEAPENKPRGLAYWIGRSSRTMTAVINSRLPGLEPGPRPPMLMLSRAAAPILSQLTSVVWAPPARATTLRARGRATNSLAVARQEVTPSKRGIVARGSIFRFRFRRTSLDCPQRLRAKPDRLGG
jgi:hypothetical protein